MSHEYRNQSDINNNRIIDDMLDNMPEYIEDFRVHLNNKNCATSTVKAYIYEIKKFLEYVATLSKKNSIMDVELDDLDKVRITQIERYIDKSDDGIDLSPNTKNRKTAVLKKFYKYFIGIGYLKNNPTLLIESSKVPEKKVVKLSDPEVAKLLSTIRNQEGISEHAKAYNEKLVLRDLAISMVFLGTGMRLSELVGLDLSDIVEIDGDYYLDIVRKGSDDDHVKLVPEVYKVLFAYLDESRPFLSKSESENALFLSTRGTRFAPNSIEIMMKKHFIAAKLSKKYSPHKMRATFATKVYEVLKDIYAIKDALHHKSIETSKHYIGDKEGRIAAAANAASLLFE
ncbi:MAG: hypothetical protein E7272_07655 [Pseudobutyrivibrio ruminis]|uniref:Integrase n=1 Tax=Pseudobutyrivibrio ruminis TaxID=46206 RepID=A0A927UD61_9FIRM|nr:hypothetical protein [Pseudobutyrivibrio ruminis]